MNAPISHRPFPGNASGIKVTAAAVICRSKLLGCTHGVVQSSVVGVHDVYHRLSTADVHFLTFTGVLLSFWTFVTGYRKNTNTEQKSVRYSATKPRVFGVDSPPRASMACTGLHQADEKFFGEPSEYTHPVIGYCSTKLSQLSNCTKIYRLQCIISKKILQA